jgi:hypothetical protein
MELAVVEPAKFAVDQLMPTKGVLSASIQWGEAEGTEPILLHRVTVELAPVKIGGLRTPSPRLRLHSIRFGVRSWKELEGRSYRFPNVVRVIREDGESYPIYDIYGSLKLGEDYHEVVVSSLEFDEPRAACTLPVNVRGTIKATGSPPSFAPTDFHLRCGLTISDVQVLGDGASSKFPELDEARDLAASLLELDDYEPVRIEQQRPVLMPRCHDGVP